MQPHVDTIHLGTLPLSQGGVLEDAKLVYATWGRLNSDGTNVVLLPTYYTGTHDSYRPWIGSHSALDPDRWFIISPNLFGNGLSSSPSHAQTPAQRAGFPLVSIRDNIDAQHRLLTEHLGVKSVALAMGWSLGAVQSMHWAAAYPAFIRTVFSICGTASCWPLNRAFLASVRAALAADPAWMDGAYAHDAPPTRGLKAFGRVYCPWAYSSTFFRQALYRTLGFDSIEALLLAWEEEHLAWDACDLMAMLKTWEHADIGSLADQSASKALANIRAKTIIMPGSCDAYFTAEEARIEGALMPNAEVRVLDSPFGHCAGAPGRFEEETRTIAMTAHALLDMA
ncbi:alpha/beta fold hydrolase [Methylobacillus sp.]|uniref:alpha/beta fold hydrolase n=1 Tax=Methylobacillus sp. TaxID=56818 RepID=UPI0012C8A6AE|nr:alpha/beta fold hydrolase [Methylobacillus sp.]MPS47578.1 alpha/beta fold hydrolase [Methylobacillus sp.]